MKYTRERFWSRSQEWNVLSHFNGAAVATMLLTWLIATAKMVPMQSGVLIAICVVNVLGLMLEVLQGTLMYDQNGELVGFSFKDLVVNFAGSWVAFTFIMYFTSSDLLFSGLVNVFSCMLAVSVVLITLIGAYTMTTAAAMLGRIKFEHEKYIATNAELNAEKAHKTQGKGGRTHGAPRKH